MLLLLLLPFVYGRSGYVPQGVFLLFGVAFGFVFQRSRFCLVRAFREPFMTGDGEHTRAAALAASPHLSGLEWLDLKGTGLTDEGANALAASAQLPAVPPFPVAAALAAAARIWLTTSSRKPPW